MDDKAPVLTRATPPGEPRRGDAGPGVGGLVLGVAAAWCRIELLAFHASECGHAWLTRRFDSAQRLAGAAFSEALSADEKSRLTVQIYDFYPGYLDVSDNLYPFEEEWLARRLPSPPCQLLVGACGTGREAIALAERGYRVQAVEPAPQFVSEARRRLGARAPVTQLSYEALSAIVLDGAKAPAEPLLAMRFGAVLLGCGSLTHVLQPREQQRLLQALNVLCPRGPILASFFCTEEAQPAPPPGRAVRAGRRIGRAIARLRGMPPAGGDRLSYRAHSGFAYTFTEREIEALGASAGRHTVWERRDTRPSHYATFLPPGVDPQRRDGSEER